MFDIFQALDVLRSSPPVTTIFVCRPRAEQFILVCFHEIFFLPTLIWIVLFAYNYNCGQLYSFELIFGGNENKFICFWEFLSFNWCLLVWILKLLVLLCSLIDIRKFVKTHSRFYNSPNNISKSNMFRQVQTKGSDPIVSPQLLSSIPCQFVMKTR